MKPDNPGSQTQVLRFTQSLADSELVSLSRIGDHLEVTILLWNEKTMILSFEEVLAIEDLGALQLSALTRGPCEGAFSDAALQRMGQSDRANQFWLFVACDETGDPVLRVVARTVSEKGS